MVCKTFTITMLIEKLFIPAKIDESIKLLFSINTNRDDCTKGQLISKSISGLMPNLIQKSWTVSNSKLSTFKEKWWKSNTKVSSYVL